MVISVEATSRIDYLFLGNDVALYLGPGMARTICPGRKKEERERQLKGLALIMSAQAGKVSDESTRINSVTYSDEVMRISYTLTKVTKNEIDSDEFTKDAKALAASAFCNEKGLGQFVKSGLSIDLLYKDSTSSPIVEFQIGKSDCL
ncbi:hypothetical protein [Pseudomonas sp. TH08]|uniref:hypothetical protein n=1 Tax=Pseudomonas sp. TH08 TaxID=2796374 RepID=UPI001F5B7232|nr:hypothetical protein [Pseudomonas sp. TH08]